MPIFYVAISQVVLLAILALSGLSSHLQAQDKNLFNFIDCGLTIQHPASWSARRVGDPGCIVLVEKSTTSIGFYLNSRVDNPADVELQADMQEALTSLGGGGYTKIPRPLGFAAQTVPTDRPYAQIVGGPYNGTEFNYFLTDKDGRQYTYDEQVYFLPDHRHLIVYRIASTKEPLIESDPINYSMERVRIANSVKVVPMPDRLPEPLPVARPAPLQTPIPPARTASGSAYGPLVGGTFNSYDMTQTTMALGNAAVPKRTFTGHLTFANDGTYQYTAVESSGPRWTLEVTGVYSVSSSRGQLMLTLMPDPVARPIAPFELQRLQYEGFPGTRQQSFTLILTGRTMEITVVGAGTGLFLKR